MSHSKHVLTMACTAALLFAACEEDDADSEDAGTPEAAGACGGECAATEYTECTCNPSDPCHWSGDGYCDWRCRQVVLPNFVDSDCDYSDDEPEEEPSGGPGGGIRDEKPQTGK